jgi:hypothetical protein
MRNLDSAIAAASIAGAGAPKVTSDMVDAGLNALWAYEDSGDYFEMMAAIFRAMISAQSQESALV